MDNFQIFCVPMSVSCPVSVFLILILTQILYVDDNDGGVDDDAS